MVEIITPEEREQGPDANQVRRHAKKMLTVAEYNKKYRRIGYYRPNLKQRDWHGLPNQETAIRAGNQCGKRTAGAAQMTFDASAGTPLGTRDRSIRFRRLSGHSSFSDGPQAPHRKRRATACRPGCSATSDKRTG
jgi:hypothetical protein